MLYYDRIDDVSEEINVIICHYWCFLIKVFKFQPDICNDCHDVLMTSVNLNIHGTGYRYY